MVVLQRGQRLTEDSIDIERRCDVRLRPGVGAVSAYLGSGKWIGGLFASLPELG